MDLLERLKCFDTIGCESIVRKIDELGRIVIPYEFRRDILHCETIVSVNIIEDFIVLKKANNDQDMLKKPLDELGRILINKELREKLKLQPKDSISICALEDCIVMKKVLET